MLVAFVPFFAFGEISSVLGEGKLLELFFRRRGAGSVGNSQPRDLVSTIGVSP